MKKIQFLSLLLVVLFVSISFQSCVKDSEDTIAPTDNNRWIVIGIGRQYNSCRPGGLICIRVDDLKEKEALATPLETDEALSKPTVLSDGSLQMQMKVDVEQLSRELRAQLLEKKALVLDEGFVLSENVVRQAYTNAGLNYSGQKVEVEKGVYQITSPDGGGTSPQSIIITITFSKGKVTITISW